MSKVLFNSNLATQRRQNTFIPDTVEQAGDNQDTVDLTFQDQQDNTQQQQQGQQPNNPQDQQDNVNQEIGQGLGGELEQQYRLFINTNHNQCQKEVADKIITTYTSLLKCLMFTVNLRNRIWIPAILSVCGIIILRYTTVLTLQLLYTTETPSTNRLTEELLTEELLTDRQTPDRHQTDTRQTTA